MTTGGTRGGGPTAGRSRPRGWNHERPLAKRGRRDAPLAGRWLGEAGWVPDAVVCSTARRARETWTLASAGLSAAVPAASPDVRYEPRV